MHKEESRLEAYRRLAAVTTQGEVDDIRAEWEDRYGPIPAVAEALLSVATLRAECHRVGVHDVTVTAKEARLAPLVLRTSEVLRLKRLARDSIYKEDQARVVLPLRRNLDPSAQLVTFLRELIPAS